LPRGVLRRQDSQGCRIERPARRATHGVRAGSTSRPRGRSAWRSGRHCWRGRTGWSS